MILKKRSVVRAWVALLSLLSCETVQPHDPTLVEGFRNPGLEARPRAYWNWLNGDISLEGITRDMEEAKKTGLGGLQIWDSEAMRNPGGFVAAGPRFLGPESVKAIRHAMAEASRLDLELGLICASGWNSGGDWITPELASKNLFHAGIQVEGEGSIRRRLPFPEVPKECPRGADGLPSWYLDVAVLAWPYSESKQIKDLSEVVDISDKFRNGELVWDAPPGRWHIERFVCSTNGQQLIAASPNSKGYFIDFLDPEATRFHFEYIFNQLGLEKGKENQTRLKTLDDDSMELHGGIQWTKGFADWFENQHGYSPIKWLPVFLGWDIDNQDRSVRFRYDYQKSVSDLLIYSHYTTGSEVCEEYGVQLAAEAGGPGAPFWESCPVDALKALGNVHIPRGEFWMGNPRNLFLVKEIASASHIYGKKIVDAESWTTWRRWRDGPFTLKRLVDRAFAEGLNRVTYHVFAHTPVTDGFPGRTYHAGVDINPQVTWWSKARPFMDYLARCSYLLQQGRYVADVAYYYGDQAPNFWPLYHNVPDKPRIDGLGPGFEYDVVNTDVILNRLSVKDGLIVLPDGMSYRILVLPDRRDMPLEVLEKLESLVSQGATLLGPKPSEVPGQSGFPGKTERLLELAEAMWSEKEGVNRYGKGKVVTGYSPEQWLKLEGLTPDFAPEDPALRSSFDFIHRETASSHIYFVHNKTTEPLRATCLFRVGEAFPQVWDPSDGSIKDQYVFQQMGNAIRMPVVLAPGGSTFVVFAKNGSGPSFRTLTSSKSVDLNLPEEEVVQATSRSVVLECWQNGTYTVQSKQGKKYTALVEQIPLPYVLEGAWKLEFAPEWGAPSEAVFPDLISWTDHEHQGIRYYSGLGTYRKSINVPSDWLAGDTQIYLDLGDVREVAEVMVNGRSAGIVWKPPFHAAITDLVQPGENCIRIEVANLWVNRLAGDKQLPDSERFTRSNIQADGGSWLANYSEWQEEPSGLLGPVRVLFAKRVELK
ncbi:putative acetyl xylan esterase [Lunatimonas lonarensis]|uniref:Putative acetyl xylan esterase n=1 Tax=Lunatimonas lonarensis TaxID=1232681 RepID=R7ZYA4_9BACT|nr:glycosyl hydrolase [Lunatimonas lonarensis]EON79072.1 putative acetyl xylan esterase [Lunatimonas lonarensis]